MQTKIQNNKVQFEAEAGDYIRGDEWRTSSELLPGDWFCPFRYVSSGGLHRVAVRVEITGKSLRRVRAGEFGIRCRITVIGDGEPDHSFPGWLFPKNN